MQVYYVATRNHQKPIRLSSNFVVIWLLKHFSSNKLLSWFIVAMSNICAQNHNVVTNEELNVPLVISKANFNKK